MQHQHHDPYPEDPVMAEECPGCHTTDQVRSTGNTLNTAAWACDGCGMGWAIALVNLHLRDRVGDYAEQAGALRWCLQQVITLAEEAPTLTDEELRARCTRWRSRVVPGELVSALGGRPGHPRWAAAP